MILQELKEALLEYDEYTLVDKLSITSTEIVERFDDKIEDKFDELVEEEIGS
jgi:hypothetical protein